MTVDEFNEKYKDYLVDRFYGMEMENLKIIDLVDKAFQEWIKIPGFKYYQIKNKFGTSRVYCDEVDTHTLEQDIDLILKKEREEYENSKK